MTDDDPTDDDPTADDDRPRWADATLGSRLDAQRGDQLVTLMLVTFAEMQGGAKGTTEAEAQLRGLIAADPDPAGLIFLFVLEKAIRVIGEAGQAGLEPLEYWQRQLLTRADQNLRFEEILKRMEIPEDVLETEERIMRERRERDAAAVQDDDPDDDAGPAEL